MEELCPDVWFLNYTNPMAINCRAIGRASRIRTVGLCHSVQGTAFELSLDLDIPYRDVDYPRRGHQSHGVLSCASSATVSTLYPQLKTLAESGAVPENQSSALRDAAPGWATSSPSRASTSPSTCRGSSSATDPISSNGSTFPLDEYPRRCIEQIKGWESERARLERGAAIEVQPSFEYAATIIRSIENRQAARDLRQRAQRRLIDDLPAGCTVEVPCLVDGIRRATDTDRCASPPPARRALDPHSTSTCTSSRSRLPLDRSADHVYHRAMLDPHRTAAELDLDQHPRARLRGCWPRHVRMDTPRSPEGDRYPHFGESARGGDLKPPRPCGAQET